MSTAVFRRLGPRGVAIAGLVTLVLVIALIVGLLGWAIGNAQPPARPSPSNAIVAMTSNDGQAGAIIHAGVSARDGAVVWSASMPNGGYYVASADGIYYTTGVNPGNVPTFTAYRMSDGAQLWSMTSPVSTPYQQPILVTHGLLLFSATSSAASPPGAIYALDVTTHTLAWSASVPEGILVSKAEPEVAANADMLFVGTVSSAAQPVIGVTALRLSDGATAWSHPVSGLAQAPTWPSHWLSAGPDTVYVADATGVVVALRQSDGALAWRSQGAANGQSGMQLTYSGATLYECGWRIADDAGQRTLFALDPTTGGLRWRTATGSCGGQLVELGGTLYLAEQDLIAMRASNGAVLWRVSPQNSGESYLSLQVDAGVVIAAASVTGESHANCAPIFLPGLATQCSYTGYLATYNASTGALYWRKNINDSPYLISRESFIQSRPMYFP